jgi:hypothetical protein
MGRKGFWRCKNLAIYCQRHWVINTAILQILSRVLGIVTKYVFEDTEREI